MGYWLSDEELPPNIRRAAAAACAAPPSAPATGASPSAGASAPALSNLRRSTVGALWGAPPLHPADPAGNGAQGGAQPSERRIDQGRAHPAFSGMLPYVMGRAKWATMRRLLRLRHARQRLTAAGEAAAATAAATTTRTGLESPLLTALPPLARTVAQRIAFCEDEAAREMQSTDTDGDGLLSQAELLAAAPEAGRDLGMLLWVLDTNGDGLFALEEALPVIDYRTCSVGGY